MSSIMETKEYSMEPTDINQHRNPAAFCYLGFLSIFMLAKYKNSEYVRFHGNQGLLLFITGCVAELIYYLISLLLETVQAAEGLWMLHSAIVLIVGGMMILGMLNAKNGKAKELPIIGSLRIIK